MGSKKNKNKYSKKKPSMLKGLCNRAKTIIKFNKNNHWNILIFISEEYNSSNWISKPTSWTKFKVHVVTCNSDVITILNSYEDMKFKSIVFAPDHGCDGESNNSSTIKWDSKYVDIGYESTLPR